MKMRPMRQMQPTNLYTFLFIMFMISFIIQYFIMSLVMSNSITNVTSSLGKLYLSVLIGLFTILVELFIAKNSNIFLYLFINMLIFITIYFYRNQVFIGDKDYISDMIEHHSMTILINQEILKKTKNTKVADLANRIVQTQTKEIQEMQQLL